MATLNSGFKGEIIMTNEQKRWKSLPKVDNETIKIWLDTLLEDKGKKLKKLKQKLKKLKVQLITL